MENKKRLIDANAFYAEMERRFCANCNYIDGKCEECLCLKVGDMLANTPTVDAVVLPCKVGDVVWIAGDRFPAEIERIIIDADGISFEYVEYDRGYEVTEVWDNGIFKPEDIGKTVFLTQEEAERREGE